MSFALAQLVKSTIGPAFELDLPYTVRNGRVENRCHSGIDGGRQMSEYERQVWNMLVKAIDAWFLAQCSNRFDEYYLYYRQSQPSLPGALAIAMDLPDAAWELADPRRVLPSWSKDVAKSKLIDCAKRLPVLSID